MTSKLWVKLTTTITGGAIIIALFTILSNLMGLLRDRTLASYFGAGPILDSYYAAFKLPDLIFNTLVLGALASAFIPVFTRVWLKDKDQALKVANAVLNYLLVILIVLAGIVFILAQPIVKLIVPGFSGAELAQTIGLTRIMLISIVFFGASNIIGGLLNSWKKFLSYSAAPVFYNLGIIFGIVVFYRYLGVSGLAWGVVLGSALHLGIQLPEALKNGWRYRFNWQFSNDVKKIFKLIIPRTIGLAANQINQVVIVMIGSTLAAGSIAVFNLANNFQTFPSSLFGISLAIAIFPILSESLAQHDQERFVKNFSLYFRRILFLIIPVSVMILLLRAQIVRVVLGSGHFDWNATYHVAQTLGWFSLSLFTQSLIPLVARAFYALEDTLTPVIVSFISVAVNVMGTIYFGQKFGVEGLAIAFSIASIINLILLMVVLRLRLGYLDDRKIIWSTFKISLNSLLAGVVTYLLLQFLVQFLDTRTFWGILGQGAIAGGVGLAVYFGLSLLTDCEEISVLKEWLGRYFKFLAKDSN